MVTAFLLWLAVFSVTPQTHDQIVLRWQTHDQTNLRGFYVYRQTETGWVPLREGYIPAKARRRYRLKDTVACGKTYTYLLRAIGQKENQAYFEDWRINQVRLRCAK